jgi:hypothetical protein
VRRRDALYLKDKIISFGTTKLHHSAWNQSEMLGWWWIQDILDGDCEAEFVGALHKNGCR